MNKKIKWIQRRWLDFRQGHGTYMSFIPSMGSFILMCYNFIPSVQDIFPSVVTFGIVFLSIYCPTAVLVGSLHNKYQQGVDIGMRFKPVIDLIKDNHKEVMEKMR